ncbi:hypothetical protein LA6_001086 [Marinibacterium anthonyi]|nr:hypothetical protein LA6_001086 [Marinibacterium anthonyi]
MGDNLDHVLSTITPTTIDEAELTKFRSEADFVEKYIELLIEAGSSIIICGHILPNGAEGWTRNEAIIGGLLIRLHKLIDMFLDQVRRDRRETVFMAARLHFETVVNMFFLMDDPSAEVFNDFVHYSLQYEIRLLDKIRRNIGERGGVEEPIEARMQISINRAFERARTTEQEARAWKKGKWSKLDLYRRSELIGLQDVYLAVFRGGSLIIHGNWADLDQHHLKFENDLFNPVSEFNPVRPQYFDPLCSLSIHAFRRTIEHYGLINIHSRAVDMCNDYLSRLKTLSEAHEAFLAKA